MRTIDILESGAEMEVCTGEEDSLYTVCEIPVECAYEDEDIVIFNKPADMPCHPSKGHPYNTVADVFYTHPSTRGLIFRCTGRLDTNTSGLVLIAKNAHACYNLCKNENIKKEYLAIVCGEFEGSIKIDEPIERQEFGLPQRCVREDGKPAVTFCESILTGEKYSLVKLRLETGRTHQIRAHMKYLGLPLAGDGLYGGNCEDIGRQALHCFYMKILKGADTIAEVSAWLPKDMQDFLEKYFKAEEIIKLKRHFQ